MKLSLRTYIPALLLLALLLAIPAHAETPALSGTLALGAANQGLTLGGGAARTTFGIEGTVRLANVAGPLSLHAGVRHFPSGDPFWRGKSRVKAGIDLRVTGDAALFATWERAYHADREWLFAGVRLSFRDR